ncbi:MAG: succinyldiaminopimelate transaminase [Pseudomonadota bacterium]
MNPRLGQLHDYPFERLGKLLAGVEPPAALAPISLALGEPQHAAPTFVVQSLQRHLHQLTRYPTTTGLPALREAIAQWLQARFELTAVDPERHVLPVCGTREGLYSCLHATLDSSAGKHPTVVVPNPGYQIYEGATLLAGARPWYLALEEDDGWAVNLDRVPEHVWRDCQLLVLCTPGNPTGAVADLATLRHAIELAHRHDFVVFSDECYSELYLDESAPPAGLLAAATSLGEDTFARCAVFHSLSKRSNLPGLRSGFVAGDARLMSAFRRYRTYHGCAMPLPTQHASIAAWGDEAHVRENRAAYREKFALARAHLPAAFDAAIPPASFYLWARPPIDAERFAREAWARQALKLLPGAYMARRDDSSGRIPGADRVRISLVPTVEACTQALQRLRALLDALAPVTP